MREFLKAVLASNGSINCLSLCMASGVTLYVNLIVLECSLKSSLKG